MNDGDIPLQKLQSFNNRLSTRISDMLIRSRHNDIATLCQVYNDENRFYLPYREKKSTREDYLHA